MRFECFALPSFLGGWSRWHNILTWQTSLRMPLCHHFKWNAESSFPFGSFYVPQFLNLIISSISCLCTEYYIRRCHNVCFNHQIWFKKFMKRRIIYYLHSHFYPFWFSFPSEIPNFLSLSDPIHWERPVSHSLHVSLLLTNSLSFASSESAFISEGSFPTTSRPGPTKKSQVDSPNQSHPIPCF